jgi:hypothetical protein
MKSKLLIKQNIAGSPNFQLKLDFPVSIHLSYQDIAIKVKQQNVVLTCGIGENIASHMPNKELMYRKCKELL